MTDLGFAVLDFETTGLHPGTNHRVVEVAVVHLDGSGRITNVWETLVNPRRDLGAQAIHRIEAAEILPAPTFEQIAGHLVQLLQGRVLAAHNARFDLTFLEAELRRMGVAMPLQPNEAVCTMQLARSFLPGAGRSLADCCAAFDIDLDGAHTAVADALATAHLLASYLRQEPEHPIWRDVAGTVNRVRWPALPITGAVPVPRRRDGAAQPHFLERIADRLPEQSGAAEHVEYLALLDRCLLDRRLSEHEKSALVELAEQLGIERSACERLHRMYFDQVVASAWADHVLTADEQRDLRTVADLLAIGEPAFEAALAGPPDTNRAIDMPAVVAAQAAFRLAAGDRIVLTGEMRRAREEWHRELAARGFVPSDGVTKKVRLLVAADPDSLSGKARKARDYGIPIVDEAGLDALLTSA